MGSRPWYKRYPIDFIGGTLSLTLEEKGAYSIVLDLLYDRGGPIPDDSKWLARVCGCSTRRWNQIRQRLLEAGKIVITDEGIDNARAKKQRLNEEKEHEKFVENGAKGAEKTNKIKAEPQDNNNIGEKGPPEKSRHTRSQIPEAREEERERRAPAKRGTRLPEDWHPTDADIAFCTEIGISEDVARTRIAPRFKDYWLAQPGQRGVKLDWAATWRNWCRREHDRAVGKPAAQERREPVSDVEIAAEWAARNYH